MRTAILLAGIMMAEAIDRCNKSGMSEQFALFVASILFVVIIMDIVDFFRGF